MSLALYAATATGEAFALARFHVAASSVQFSLGMSVLATATMGAVGLYNYEVFLDSRLMVTKALFALAMVVPAAAIAGLFFTGDMLGGLADSWHALCLKATAAWMGCVILTRMAFLRFSDSEMFRRQVVVLGTGVRAARIADLATRHGNRRVADGKCIIEIADQGPGMAPEFIHRELFRPFRTTKDGGYGIGAYQTRELIRAAGGELDVESQPGGGGTMRIVLPLASEGAVSSAA